MHLIVFLMSPTSLYLSKYCVDNFPSSSIDVSATLLAIKLKVKHQRNLDTKPFR